MEAIIRPPKQLLLVHTAFLAGLTFNTFTRFTVFHQDFSKFLWKACATVSSLKRKYTATMQTPPGANRCGILNSLGVSVLNAANRGFFRWKRTSTNFCLPTHRDGPMHLFVKPLHTNEISENQNKSRVSLSK